MGIWLTQATPEILNQLGKGTMVEHLGIEFLEVGEDYIKARMPVDKRTFMPLRILHGGASAALAETLGSVAANLCVERGRKVCLGIEINANHIRSATSGFVYGVAKPIHIGGATQVWEIRINDEQQKLTCISRLTLTTLEAKKSMMDILPSAFWERKSS